jgi:antitoxin YefM
MDIPPATPSVPCGDVAHSSVALYADLYNIAYKEAAVKPLRVTEDIRSLSEFRAGVASFVKQVNETRRPLVLTQNGRGVAVLVDIQEYDAMVERIEILGAIIRANADIAAGRVTPHEEAMDQLLKSIGE